MSFILPFSSKLIGFALAVGILSGCATRCCEGETVVTVTTTESVTTPPMCGGTVCPPHIIPAAPVKLLAVGYGAIGIYSQYSNGQQKLMAMRAAQVDAYRNLAEQVYGFRVWGNTSVSAFATQSDNIRSYVDAFIRGARVVNTTTIADGNFETTVELEVSQRFLDYLNLQKISGARSNMPATCAVPGCVAPSGYYISN
jgi:hypothetical protein